jgi:hypothetical protein
MTGHLEWIIVARNSSTILAPVAVCEVKLLIARAENIHRLRMLEGQKRGHLL